MTDAVTNGVMDEVRPSLADVRELAREHDVVPLALELRAMSATPLDALRELSASEPCLLFESGVPSGTDGGWSFLAHSIGQGHDTGGADPLRPLDDVAQVRAAPVHGLDAPFIGGVAGFISYEAARHYERIPTARDVLHVPDAWFADVDNVIAFDHVGDRVLLITSLRADTAVAAYEHAALALRALAERLRAVAPAPPSRAREPGRPAARAHDDVANLSREGFMRAVQRAKEYIVAGDIFQVQISRRFSLPLGADSLTLYEVLRDVNPSPYMFHMATPHGTLVGTSPEMLVRVSGRDVRYHPIAGTRRRGRDPADDARLERELRGSDKETAEHLMLVDLGRNDVGRVCATGSVRVTQLMEVERYSHVMHLVSSIEGRLRDDCSSVDALRACFPAGTVTGAPKIRAMEIIAELEPEARGIYAGAVGYASWGGDIDTAITLRTLLVRDGVAYAQAAGGVVADSTPEEEALEIDNKVSAMLQAVHEVSHA